MRQAVLYRCSADGSRTTHHGNPAASFQSSSPSPAAGSPLQTSKSPKTYLPRSRKKESLKKTRIHRLIYFNGESLWRSHGAPRGAEFAWDVSHSHSYAVIGHQPSVIGHQPSSTVFHFSLGSGIGEVARDWMERRGGGGMRIRMRMRTRGHTRR